MPERATDIELRDDLIYDVGMHRGEDTAYYLAKGFDVVAFEADPALVEHCRARFAREIADGRLRIVEGAIVDAPGDGGTVRFFKHESLSMWGTTDSEWAGRRAFSGDFAEVEVPAVDFAKTIAETGMPHFMKIDIEGADSVCLAALEKFAAGPRYLSIESEKFDFARLEAEIDLLGRLGFTRFAVVQQGSIPGSETTTTTRDGAPLRYRFERDASGGFGDDVGPWLDREDALRRYRAVFREYRMFGEGSLVRRFRAGRILMGRLPRWTGRSWPGWYDTHAARD